MDDTLSSYCYYIFSSNSIPHRKADRETDFFEKEIALGF